MVGRAPLRWSDAQNRSGLVDRDLKSLEGERLVDHSSVVERLENEPMRRWGFDVLDFYNLRTGHGDRRAVAREDVDGEKVRSKSDCAVEGLDDFSHHGEANERPVPYRRPCDMPRNFGSRSFESPRRPVFVNRLWLNAFDAEPSRPRAVVSPTRALDATS